MKTLDSSSSSRSRTSSRHGLSVQGIIQEAPNVRELRTHQESLKQLAPLSYLNVSRQDPKLIIDFLIRNRRHRAGQNRSASTEAFQFLKYLKTRPSRAHLCDPEEFLRFRHLQKTLPLSLAVFKNPRARLRFSCFLGLGHRDWIFFK